MKRASEVIANKYKISFQWILKRWYQQMLIHPMEKRQTFTSSRLF
ncbi:7869_t:CDS:2 [Funneliformis caledonium]|uniref:7869_t:CDS:1 n=1 Tax=Funneliformis caledonium TaxID=1117310 RepID=A0A9N9CQQ3_9GLOM|nr:7869_t:CDS:2 [Funneliformis caledonium]